MNVTVKFSYVSTGHQTFTLLVKPLPIVSKVSHHTTPVHTLLTWRYFAHGLSDNIHTQNHLQNDKRMAYTWCVVCSVVVGWGVRCGGGVGGGGWDVWCDSQACPVC